MPNVIDHIMVAVLVVVVPAYAAIFTWPKMKRRSLGTNGSAVRVRDYWGNIAALWVLASAAMAVWLYGGRPLVELGFAWPVGRRLSVGITLAVLIAAALAGQYVVTVRSPHRLERLREQLRQAAALVPQSRRELNH